jgi:CheY-like chemotaxis protein
MIPILPRFGTGGRSCVANRWIPLRASEEELPPDLEAAAQPGTPAPAAEQKQLRILIIEDNRDYADGLQVVFEILGHSAIATYNGIDGLDAALREVPDVIVCDIGLPGLDGYQVARALRQNPATAGVFLVAVTGYASDSARELAYQSGFNAHIAKPAEASRILALVAAKRKGLA